MFGYNLNLQPAPAQQTTSGEAAKLKQQLDEVLARKPTTELEKVLINENLALKAENERLKAHIENEREATAQRVLWATESAIHRTAAIYKRY